MKLHTLAQKQYMTLPKPFAAWLTPASEADLTSARQNLDFIGDICLFADKAYISSVWKSELAIRGVPLITPFKLKKGSSVLPIGDSLVSSLISAIRQPIDSFFSWLHETTNIQSASKVRSRNGLLSFVFARLASIFLF